MEEKVETKTEEKKEKKNKKLIIILIIIIVLCIGVIVALLIKNKLDYNPLEIDPNAEQIKDDDKTKLTEDGTLNAVRLSYSTKVKVSLKNKKVNVNFKNPSVSNQNMTLTVQIIDGKKEIEIAKSKSVPVGYLIKELELNKNVSLKKGKYKGQFVINYYKEGTNEKSMMDTKTPITIEVS